MILFEQFKKVKAFVFDVDGVLTNGEILVTENGDQLRQFYIKDGYALQLAIKQNYPIAVITGGKSEGVRLRLESLGIKNTFINVSDKLSVLKNWLQENHLDSKDILFMGDDIPDLEVMQMIGFAACPADAIQDIKEISHYISPLRGGRGAVRDVIEKVLRLHNKWSCNSNIKSM